MSERRGKVVWAVVLGVAGLFLLYRALFSPQGLGREYVSVREVVAVAPGTDIVEGRWTVEEQATYRDELLRRAGDPAKQNVRLSVSRTIGLWFAAFLTLAIFSFIYRDNPLYKLAEAIFIGVSAAYWMVIAFWNVLVPNLLAKLAPQFVHDTFIPGLAGDDLQRNWLYLVPLALGVMLLWRLAPRGQWIARWPLAFFIGVFAGLRLVQFFHADFLNQIAAGIKPLVVSAAAVPGDVVAAGGGGEAVGGVNWSSSIGNVVSVVGVLCCLAYFLFSFERRGVGGRALGGAARVGIWVLMITFGAMFGYTVMGRVVLLVARIEFLLNDWLWLIDPAGLRVP